MAAVSTLASLLAAPAAPAPSDPTTTYVIMGGATFFIIYVMTRLTKRKKKDPFEAPFQTRGLAQHRSVERQMENLLVELSEMSRQMSAQLDTRAAKLEIIIRDADERIARLEELNRQAPPRPFAMPTEPGVAAVSPEPPPIEAVTAPVAPLVPVTPDPIAMMKADDVAPSPPIDPGHAEIYRLADEGQSVSSIARELGRPSGEVELILALRPRG